MRFFLLFCVFLCGMAGAAQAGAAQAGAAQAGAAQVGAAQAGGGQRPTVIAIVDVPKVLQESGAARSVQEQIEERRSTFQAQIALEEKGLREAEQKLAALRQSGDGEAYSDEEQKLRQRFTTVERHVQSRRKALDQAFTEAMGTVRQNIIDIVAAISKERGVNLAIAKQQVIWNDATIDITREVLTRLNKKLPTLNVSIQPEGEDEEEPAAFKDFPVKKKKSQALERER